MAFPNVSNRSDQTFYTGPAGNGTALTAPVTVVGSDGVSDAVVAAAVATDSATTLALANNLRAGLIALGLFTAA
jgi:hypothetical protein